MTSYTSHDCPFKVQSGCYTMQKLTYSVSVMVFISCPWESQSTSKSVASKHLRRDLCASCDQAAAEQWGSTYSWEAPDCGPSAQVGLGRWSGMNQYCLQKNRSSVFLHLVKKLTNWNWKVGKSPEREMWWRKVNQDDDGTCELPWQITWTKTPTSNSTSRATETFLCHNMIGITPFVVIKQFNPSSFLLTALPGVSFTSNSLKTSNGYH